jgi:hypothetical protein
MIPKGTDEGKIRSAVTEGYLPSSVSYCRWFWSCFQTEESADPDFSLIEKAMAVAKERRQTLAVRLMSYGSPMQPQVPDWYANSYGMKEFDGHLQPDHNSEDYLRLWGGFIKAFGKRFDGHPVLESVDITFVGPWGEGAGDCSEEQCENFAKVFTDSFQKTKCIALIEGAQLKAGVARGSGWRADCFGDLANPGSPDVPRHQSWNHMYDCYPKLTCETEGARDAWKTAPVHFESCWVPGAWHMNGSDIDFIIKQGLKYHATYFMPKSSKIPDEWKAKIEKFCRRLGYRFVLRQFMFQDEIEKGEACPVECWIENVGVAPIYRDLDVAIRVRQGEKVQVQILDDVDPKTWIPGDQWLKFDVKIPDDFDSGRVDLSIGLLDPLTGKPKVRFAVEERYSDSWVPGGEVFVR